MKMNKGKLPKEIEKIIKIDGMDNIVEILIASRPPPMPLLGIHLHLKTADLCFKEEMNYDSYLSPQSIREFLNFLNQMEKNFKKIRGGDEK
jgi:hypothetical protein